MIRHVDVRMNQGRRFVVLGLLLLLIDCLLPQNSLAATDAQTLSANVWNFQPVFSYDLGTICIRDIVASDFDKDGKKDITLLGTSSSGAKSTLLLLHNLGNWQFTQTVIGSFLSSGIYLGSADMNGDGWDDLVVTEGLGLHVYLNDRQGKFSLSPAEGMEYSNCSLMDVNSDGAVDILTGLPGSSGGYIKVYLNDGLGTSFTPAWQSRPYGAANGNIISVFAVNLNGDSHPDIAAIETNTGLLLTFTGDGTGNRFTEQTNRSLGNKAFSLDQGDINHDGLADMAVFVGTGKAKVFLTGPNASVEPYWTSPDFNGTAFHLSLTDFDRNGELDLFVLLFSGGEMRIFQAQPETKFALAWSSELAGYGYPGITSDMDNDGSLDLIAGERDASGINRLRIFRNLFTQGIQLYLPVVQR